jgi:tetratricopeptide (TPR) repeat protein
VSKLNHNIKKISILSSALLLILAIIFVGYNKLSAGDKVEKQLELGVKYLSENKYEEAVLTYREVIKIDKKNEPAYKGLSIAYTLQEKPDQAEQALQDGLKQVTGSYPLKLALAGLLADQNKKDQAEAIYKEIITIDGSYLPAYQAYARLLVGLNRQKDAVALLEKAAEGNAGQYRISSLLAEQYIKSGSKDKAMVAINQSLSSEPNQAASYKLLEELYNGRWTELNALGDQYIQQGKSMPGQIIRLTGLYKLAKYNEMVKLYEQLSSDLKASPKISLLTAQAYSKLGQKEKGISLSKEVKPESIKDSALVAEIANFYLEAGDKATARSLALKGISLDDTVIDNYVVLSKSYQDEDQSQAVLWKTKSLLNSVFSIQQARKDQELNLSKTADVSVSDQPVVSDNIPNSQIVNKQIEQPKPLNSDDFGVNGIKLDMSQSEVENIIGRPQYVKKVKDSSVIYGGVYYEYSHDEYVYPGLVIEYLDGIDKITVTDGNYLTARNIGIGDTYNEVISVYGQPNRPSKGTIEYNLWFSGGSFYVISFFLNNNVITKIHIYSAAV